MHAVDVYLVIGDGDWNKLAVGTTLDSVPDVVDVARDFVTGPLKESYPALYAFAEFGLQAVESFMVVMSDVGEYTARIGVADLSAIPVYDRELAAQLVGNFVTALRVIKGRREEAALKLLDTQHTSGWESASFTVEPGDWLTRHLTSGGSFDIASLQA